MENAGAAVARVVRERYPAPRRIAVLCGKGNNGGDGFVAARHLRDRQPEVFLLGRAGGRAGRRARCTWAARATAGIAVREVPDEAAWRAAREEVGHAGLLVDALLGTGLREEPSGLTGRVIEEVARCGDRAGRRGGHRRRASPRTRARSPGPALRADVTVTFAAPKHGHVLPPACDRTGELIVADIGIRGRPRPSLGLIQPADAARAYPPRASRRAQGRLRARAGRRGLGGEDRSRRALRNRGAARGRGARDGRDARSRCSRSWRAARAELMTEPLPGGPALRDAASSSAARVDAVVARSGPGRGAPRRSRASSSAGARCRS